MLRAWAVQDSPPGAATAALVARCDDRAGRLAGPGALRAAHVVALYNPRTATAIVPGRRGRGVRDGAAARRRRGAEGDRRLGGAGAATRGSRSRSRSRSRRSSRRAGRRDAEPRRPARGAAAAAAGRAAAVVRGLQEPPRAARAAGAGRPARPALHRGTGRAPAGVRAHRPAGRAGTPPREDGGPSSCARYRPAYGPSTPAHFAQWAGIGNPRARDVGARSRRARAASGSSGAAAAGARATRCCSARDREALVPDPALPQAGLVVDRGAGVVLADGGRSRCGRPQAGQAARGDADGRRRAARRLRPARRAPRLHQRDAGQRVVRSARRASTLLA